MSRARAVLLLLACFSLVPVTAFAAGIPIRGRVLDSSGAALAKARVRLVPLASAQAAGRLELEGKEEPEAVASAESGADGGFRLDAPQPGMWKVVVGGGSGDRLVSQEAWAAPLTGDLDLPAVRLPRDAGLTVRVVGPDGRPVPGARVRSETSSPSVSIWQNAPHVGVTDAQGRAVLERVGSAAVNVRAGASGFGIAERKEVRASSVELRLPSGAPLPLRALGADGKPAAGVLVQAEGGAPLGVTGEGGLLDLVAPGGAPLDLLLIAADGRRLEAQVRALDAKEQAKEPRAPRELRLPALRVASARTVSAADSRPIPGALVWLSLDFGAFQRTDSRGEARFPAPVEETLSVQAAATGFFHAMQESRSTADRPPQPLTLSLQPDLAITGIVVDETGAPVAGAEITASLGGLQGLPMPARIRAFGARGALVRSGRDGRFRRRGLSAGMEVELRVAKDGFAPLRVQAPPPSPGQPARPLRIVLQRGRSAFGRVLDPDQRPIAGAQVTLRTSLTSDPKTRFHAALQPESLDTFEAATKADGRFDLGNLPAGRYDLTARGRGWAPLTIPNLEVPEGNRATDLGTLVLAHGVALEGAVVDASGKPVEGAEIRLNEAGEPVIPRFRDENSEPEGLSGADGFFRIEDLRAGSTVDVSVARSGYAPGAAQGVQVPTEQPLRISLQAVGSVSGRVVDPDGKPIAGAYVHVEIRPRGRGGFLAFSGGPRGDRSDAEGSFRIKDVTPGPVSLSARAPGWQDGSVPDLELRGGEDKRGVEIVLSAAAILTGRVLSPSGRAVPEAQVLLAPGESRSGGFHMSTADGDGRYVLDSLPPGQRTIEASHPEHGTVRRQVDLRVGENSLDITLEGGSEVSGRVFDDLGVPVAGADVWITSPGGARPLSTTSQSDGSFRIAAVADGSYRAGAYKEGFARAEMVPVTVDGSSVAGIELRLPRGGAIAGRITGVELSELARVQVLARGGRGLATGGRVEPDGSYRIEHLQEGEWRVRAELPGTSLYAEEVARLEPGASEVRIDLDLERGVELAVRVRRNGAPVPGEPLFLDGPQRTFGETDADGRFRFQGLSAGTYRVRLGDRSAGPSHEQTVDLQSDREITIDLPAADVTGRVVDAADSSPLSGATVQLLSRDGDPAAGRAQTDGRGLFVMRGVAEGTWRVRAQADGYAPGEANVQVDGTGASEVEIALRATEGVTLQVATATGLPSRTLFYVVLDGAGQKVGDGRAAVEEGGRARLSRVPPGAWQVLILTESTAPAEITVTSPGDAGRLTLPPPCTLRVRVPALADSPVPATVTLTGPGGRPFRTFVRMGEPTAAFAMNRGTLSLGDVPPGTWNVQVTAADGRTWRATATTAPGVEAEVVVERGEKAGR